DHARRSKRNRSNEEIVEHLLRMTEVTRSGFPCDSMMLDRWAAWYSYVDGESRMTWRGGILFPQGNGTHLSLNALWPGFAINTIFYATFLWLLFAAPGLVRRRIRIKRGLCPACAYPVGESPTCTECGKPVIRRLFVPT
ncbi:MAG: hypothetical protein L0Z53_05115, partial [Acidobacteriales bacterium]|nr:hypothetical protein [Terriglobales bacterium]